MSATFARAQQLHAAGQLEAALALYEECLRDAPDDWRALTRLGLLHVQQRRFDLATELLQSAVALNTANPEAHTWLGEAWRQQNKLEAATASFSEALRLRPDHAPALFNLGLALAQQGQNDAASAAWLRFLELRENDPRIRRELAGLALAQGDPTQAAAWLEQHLARFPGDADATAMVYRTAMALEGLAHLPSAIAWLKRAEHLAPDRADIQNSLAVAHHNFAQHDEALQHYRRALAIDPGFHEVHSNLLMALHYLPEDCEAMFGEHQAWAARHTDEIAAAARESFPNARDPERRLRIGYVSPRFCAGPIARNLLPVLEAHDKARFHVTCYAVSSNRDAVTEVMRSHVDAWREAWALDDAALQRLIGDDAIDILVDLSGHCPGHRLRMFARRAAPIQMTWLDYSDTTAVAAMDYLVGDTVQTPIDSPQRYTEEVVRLPGTRLCYRPLANLPELHAPPALRNGHVTFGCINRLSKLNPDVIATWSEILRAVPGSRLLLKGTAYASGEVRSAVAARFAHHGVEATRLDMHAYSDEMEMMLNYRDIDICLDPFPYNGSTTTCDALTMGVPVVTLAGAGIVARAGLMFLTACGMGEWVAYDQADYVRLASAAARDVHKLAVLRPQLRARFLASSACDAPAFARALEEIYRSAWKRFVAEVPPWAAPSAASSRGARKSATPRS